MASHPKKISHPDSRELDTRRNRWIAEFVEQHGSSAHRTAFRLLGNREEAHDAVQESLATALRRWQVLRSEDAAKAWFFRILVNHCISRLRKAAVRNAALRIIGRSEVSTVDLGIRGDISEAVLPRLMRLPLKQRTALILRFADERSIAEIAEAMGVSVETVKTHLKRGLAKLRKTLVDSKESKT